MTARPVTEQRRGEVAVGDVFTLEALRIAHGGHVIAHHAGWTVFVRHGLPGELLRVRVTEVTRKILRADAIEVLRPASGRIAPACPWSGPGGCGGCDFQHVDLAHQRALKTEVLTTSLTRFGHIDAGDPLLQAVEVQELPGSPEGHGWMSRVRWASDEHGTIGLRRHRSHDVVPVDHCLIAAADVAVPDTAPDAVSDTTVHRHVRHRHWRTPAESFWQVHPALPEALVATVLEFGRPKTGESWWDLYAGVGLFAGFLGEAVGRSGRVDAVEQSGVAIAGAQAALADLPQVDVHQADAASWVGAAVPVRLDGVVLDPPRSGAGQRLMAQITSREPGRIVYIACDPVALARDVLAAAGEGYRLTRLRAFDAFPMTHHFETVALLERDTDQPGDTATHALS